MADKGEIGKRVNRGLAWVGLASSMVGVLDLVANFIILALWVSTAEYGLATAAVTLFPILNIATDLGLSAAVIQRDDHTEAKISTVFWLNLAMSFAMFGLLYVGAPVLARFHGNDVIGWMLIAYGTKLIWQNLYFIPSALMRRELRFKELSVIRIIANLAEFAGKIGSAAAGYGVWCFVLGPLCRVFVTGVGVQIVHPWRPRLLFRLREAYDYATFGLKTSVSQILFHFYSNIDYQIVGPLFGPSANGLYRLAYEIVLEPARIISHVIVEIAFPAFSRLRHSRDKLIDQLVTFTRMNFVTVLTFLAFVVVVADDLLSLWGEQWVPATTATRLLCGVGVLRAMSYVIPPLLDGMGYPAQTLRYQIVATLVLPTLFLVAAVEFGDRFGYLSVVGAWVVGYPIAFGVLMWMALQRLELSALAFLRRVAGVPMCVAVACAIGWGMRFAMGGLPPIARLAGIGVVMMVVIGLLLAYTQGISPRSITRAVKGESAPPPPPPPAPEPNPEPEPEPEPEPNPEPEPEPNPDPDTVA